MWKRDTNKRKQRRNRTSVEYLIWTFPSVSWGEHPPQEMLYCIGHPCVELAVTLPALESGYTPQSLPDMILPTDGVGLRTWEALARVAVSAPAPSPSPESSTEDPTGGKSGSFLVRDSQSADTKRCEKKVGAPKSLFFNVYCRFSLRYLDLI